MISREDLIRKITDEYTKSDLSNSSQLKYNLTIKQLNALYDVYEINNYQMSAYKIIINPITPKFSNFRLFSTIVPFNMDSTTIYIKLAFDPKRMKYPVFDKYSLKGYTKNIKLRVEIKYAAHVQTVRCNFENKPYYKHTSCFIIKEFDILIICGAYPLQDQYVAFIEISTGKLLYNNVQERYASINFMLYKNDIISLHTTYKGIYYNLYTKTGDKIEKLDKEHKICLDSICDYSTIKLLSGRDFYCDSKGMYLCCGESIYKIDGDIYEIKLNGYIIWKIFYIDYVNLNIYIRSSISDKSVPETAITNIVKLGFSDALELNIYNLENF